jgi:hypothetical protein
VNILKRLFSSSLATAWTFSPGAVIWKLQATPGGILVGESRDPEGKTMSLFALRVPNGLPLFQGVRLEEPWWIALEMTVGELAVLHRYPKPDLPNTLGATVLDCESGEVLWSDLTTRIICGAEEIALAQRGTDRGDLFLIDLRTGVTLETVGGNPGRAEEFQELCERRPLPAGWVNSTSLTEDHPEYSRLSAEIAGNVVDQRGAAEVAAWEGFTVVAVHVRSRGSAEAMLANQVDTLIIVLDDGRVVYRDTIASNSPGPGDDHFFIWNGQLIFIRNRRQLVAVNLRNA